jgi:tetratricopeptide (TPR) repeat protein
MLIADEKLDAAVPFLVRAVEADRLGHESYVLLGLLFQEQNRWEQAERVWTAYLRVYPEDRSAKSQLAKAQAKLAEPQGDAVSQ